MGFTTPCFIRKNTPELRKKLEELGYTLMCGYDTGFIMTNPEFGVAFLPVGPKVEVDEDSNREYIDCGTNEFLFFAIAALRDDTDNGQVFVNGKGDWGIRRDFNNGFIMEYLYLPNDFNEENYHKASVEELIEIFKGMKE